MKFFEKNMKFIVMALVVVVGYYAYQEMKKRKEAKEMEEAVKQNAAQNGLVLVDDMETVTVS